MSEPINEEQQHLTEALQPQPRRAGALAAAVSQEIAAQCETAEMDALYEAATAEPAFDSRSGTSNFGKRVSARLQQAIRQ